MGCGSLNKDDGLSHKADSMLMKEFAANNPKTFIDANLGEHFNGFYRGSEQTMELYGR